MIKMMKIKAKRISDSFLSLLDFSNFCVNIHDKVNCEEENCKYQVYSELLLARNDKCELGNFFFSHSELYQDVFLSFENLFLSEEYFFQCLKKLIKKQ